MGMYTKLDLDMMIKDDAPEWFKDSLKYLQDKNWFGEGKAISAAPGMTIYEQIDDVPRIEHPFWKEPRMCMFHVILDRDKLHAHADIKNYNDEIEKFLDYISPFVVPVNGKVGTYWYEEEKCATNIVYNATVSRFELVD